MNKNEKVTKVYFKPILPQIVIGLAGCLLVFLHTPVSIIFGLVLIAFCLAVQLGLKDYRVCDIYEDKIVLYDGTLNNNIREEISFEDIEEWNVNRQKSYSLYLKLYNGRKIITESFNVSKINQVMKQYLYDKETNVIKARKNKETKLVFRNPFKKRREKVDIKKRYFDLLKQQIKDAYDEESVKIKEVANLICDVMNEGGVCQLIGSKHANEFVNELNFRAGGLAPYHGFNVAILKEYSEYDAAKVDNGEVYNDLDIIPTFMNHYKLDDRDMIIIVSFYGNEPLLVELAKTYKEKGQKVVVVTNLKSYEVSPALHPTGTKLLDYADLYLDMMSNEPDVALDINGLKVGQTSSTVANVIAQMITGELYNAFIERGLEVPVLLSANLKGADVHNNSLTDKYEGRVR